MGLSLAHWKYRNVSGDLFARLSFRTSQLIDSQPVFDAFAYLKASPARETFCVYGSADGNGTHATKQGAVHRAISEAMERWAYYETRHSPAQQQYGFDLDPTTTGMAAFPGLSHRSARGAAYREAIERWSIAEWWRGHLGHKNFCIPAQPHLKALEIESLWKNATTVILWSRVAGTGAMAYGFAAGATRELAVQKALVELTRNTRVLELYLSPTSNREQPKTSTERRLLYFAGQEGAKIFHDRATSLLPYGRTKAPSLVVDTPIKGPWSRYAYVWRCLFETARDNFADDTFFLF